MPLPPISPQQMWVTTQIRFKYLISTLLITICLLPPSSPASCVVSFQTTQELMTMHAREAIQACVSEFISFITDEAKERCQMESRRILTANDLLASMEALVFHNNVETLTLFLSRYRAQNYERSSTSQSSVVRPGPPTAQMARPPPLSVAAHGCCWWWWIYRIDPIYKWKHKQCFSTSRIKCWNLQLDIEISLASN